MGIADPLGTQLGAHETRRAHRLFAPFAIALHLHWRQKKVKALRGGDDLRHDGYVLILREVTPGDLDWNDLANAQGLSLIHILAEPDLPSSLRGMRFC